MKYLVCVMTCQKYYNSRLKFVYDTYLKRIKTPNEFVFLSDEDHIRYPFISFNVPKDYLASGEKHLSLIKYLQDNKNDFDYYIFVDDDTYLFVDRYINFVSKLDFSIPFCFGRVQIPNPKNDPSLKVWGIGSELPIEYPSGCAYGMNNKALNILSNYLKNNNDIPMCNYSDVALGFWFRQTGIKLIHSDYLSPTTPQEEGHTEDRVKQNYTYHRIIGNSFYDLERYN